MAKAVIDVTEDIEFSDIFYVDRDKNVGIRWDEPPARLAISGSVGEAILNVQNLLYVTGSTTSPRIGIGEIPTPGHALDMRGQLNIQSGSGTNTATGVTVSGSVGAKLLNVQNSVLIASGSTAKPRVGIGQASPNVALDVFGATTLSGSLIQSGSSTLNGPLFVSGSIGDYNFNYNNAITMSGSSLGSTGRLGINVGLTDGIDNELQVVGNTFLNGNFNQNNLVYMTGSLAGVPRVGIGLTQPNVPLDILGAVTVSGSLIQSGSSTFNEGGATITGSGVGTKMLNVNNLFVVSGSSANPRVGVGQSSPNVTLDVLGISTLSGSLTQSGSATFIQGPVLISSITEGTRLFDVNTSMITISGSTTSPRIGIGTATPNVALDVSGAATVSGSLIHSGSSTFTQGGMTITGSTVSTKMLNVNDILVVSGSTALPRVGIGKTSGAYSLDVTGSSFFYGPMTVTGSDVGVNALNVNNILYVTGSDSAPRMGVGKSTPNVTLDVFGATTLSGSLVQSGSSAFNEGGLTVTGSTVGTKMLNVNNIFSVSGSTAFPRIGINQANANVPLDVFGATTLSGSLIQSGSSTFNEGGMTITGSIVGTNILNINNLFTVSGSNASPRLAIGKTTSDYALDVTGSSYFYGPLTITGSNSAAPVLLVSPNILYVKGTDAAPRIGIGTTEPTVPLHISGSALAIATQASGSGAGVIGEIRWQVINEAAYLYLCTGSSAWVKFSGSGFT